MRRGWRDCNPHEVEVSLNQAAQRLKNDMKGTQPYPNPNRGYPNPNREGGTGGTSLAAPMGWCTQPDPIPGPSVTLKVNPSMRWPDKKTLSVLGNLDRYAAVTPEPSETAPHPDEPTVRMCMLLA